MSDDTKKSMKERKAEQEAIEKALKEKAEKEARAKEHREKAKKEKAATAKAEKKKKPETKEKAAGPVEAVAPRLIEKYKTEIVPKLKEKFNYSSPMEVPKITRVVINCGLGKAATQNIKIIDHAVKDIGAITGQKPVVTKSKLAIAAFKLRKGLSIGVKVTLRGDRMYEFLDRLISLSLPRIRDFRGISDKGFDGRGNYTMGLKDQIVFPEVEYESVESTYGMNITVVNTATTDEEGRELLGLFGFPFRKKKEQQKAA